MCGCGEVNANVGGGAYEGTYSYNYEESHMANCLGDGVGYYPICYGSGVSSLDNKVRPGTVLIWRREATVDKPYNIAYRIPPNIARGVRSLGIESVDDTFVDGANTFKRLASPVQAPANDAQCGYMYWDKYIGRYQVAAVVAGLGYNQGELCWVRSA
jgi:hypothetical protein